jgi:hypothetical protein
LPKAWDCSSSNGEAKSDYNDFLKKQENKISPFQYKNLKIKLLRGIFWNR